MKRRIILGPLAMFAVFLLLAIASAPYAKRYLESRQCGRHLAAISQVACAWGYAHNDSLPRGFIMMSNELAAPRLLICPGDKSREPADNWAAFTSANSSYEIWEGALSAREVPLEILQNIPYLRCKVHGANYANALGKVSVHTHPMPLTIRLLAGLAVGVLLGRWLWHRYKPVQGQLPGATVVGDLLPRIEQVRHDYLAARGMAPSPWYRKGLLAAARHAVRALGFFADRKNDPQGREKPRIR